MRRNSLLSGAAPRIDAQNSILANAGLKVWQESILLNDKAR